MSAQTGKLWKFVSIAFISVSVVLAGILFYQYSSYQSQYSTLSKSYNEALIANLAYAHWLAISSNNIDSLMSQYSENAIVYWFKGPLAGNYTMTSVVRGPTNSVPEAKDIKSLWLAFFNNKPAIMKIENLSVNITENKAVAKALVSFIFTGGPRTGTVLNINYELDYTFINNKWLITAEWWIPK